MAKHKVPRPVHRFVSFSESKDRQRRDARNAADLQRYVAYNPMHHDKSVLYIVKVMILWISHRAEEVSIAS